MNATSSGFSLSRQRIVTALVVTAILFISVPSPVRAQAKEDFGRQLFSTVAGALMAAGAVFLVSLVRPEPPLQAEPRRLDFGKTQSGTELTRIVTLTNTSKQAVVVDRLVFAGAFHAAVDGQVPRDVMPGEHIAVTVVFKPLQPQKSAGQLELVTRVGEKAKARTMKIQLKGDARGGK